MAVFRVKELGVSPDGVANAEDEDDCLMVETPGNLSVADSDLVYLHSHNVRYSACLPQCLSPSFLTFPISFCFSLCFLSLSPSPLSFTLSLIPFRYLNSGFHFKSNG